MSQVSNSAEGYRLYAADAYKLNRTLTKFLGFFGAVGFGVFWDSGRPSLNLTQLQGTWASESEIRMLHFSVSFRFRT